MKPNVATFVYDGDTFLGSYEVDGSGQGETVNVRYKQARASAKAHGLGREIVARVLLGELVRDDLRGVDRGGVRMTGHTAA